GDVSSPPPVMMAQLDPGQLSPGTLGPVDPVLTSLIVLPFPAGVLVLLHFLTGGIFTFFWVTGLHGKLPRLNSDDLSARRAIWFCFIPFFNLYWFFVVYIRLCLRINE